MAKTGNEYEQGRQFFLAQSFCSRSEDASSSGAAGGHAHKCRMQHMHLYTGCMDAKLSYTRPNGLVYWPYTVSGFHV